MFQSILMQHRVHSFCGLNVVTFYSFVLQEKNIELVKVILSKGEETECLEVLCQILDQLLDDCR